MTKDEALRLALEALAQDRAWLESDAPKEVWDKNNEAITSIKQALEQPEGEPVVWMYVNKSTHETFFQRTKRSFMDHGNWSEVPLYGEPLANHELQCVCGAVWCGDEMVHLPNKTSPPKRKWQGLTDDELKPICDENHIIFGAYTVDFIQSIEAKLKEKNHDH